MDMRVAAALEASTTCLLHLPTKASGMSASATPPVNQAEWKGMRQGHMRGHARNPCGQRELKRPAALGLGALSPTAIRNESTVQVNVRGISFVKDDKTAVVTPRPKKTRWDSNAATSTVCTALQTPGPGRCRQTWRDPLA